MRLERGGVTCLSLHCSPEELSHGDAALVEHRRDEFGSVEPDIRQIDGSVSQSVQGRLESVHIHTNVQKERNKVIN